MLSDQRSPVVKHNGVISGQGQTYFLKNTCTQRDPSEARDAGHKTTQLVFCCWRVCVWEHVDKWDFPSLSHVTWHRSNGAWHWTSQDWNVYLWQENQEKQSCCLGSFTQTNTLKHTPLASIYGNFKPCPLDDVKKEGIYDRQAQKNRVVWNHTHRKNAHLHEPTKTTQRLSKVNICVPLLVGRRGSHGVTPEGLLNKVIM